MEVKRSSDVIGLPSGWVREEVVRKSGLSAGKTDVYYYSPDGIKCRSKPQLARLVGDNIDLTAFDFRSGKILQSSLRKNKRLKGATFDYTRGVRHDASLVLPIRQTASIFKQPVTVKRNHPQSKTRTDLKHGPQDQPKQLFWEKRLQGLNASDITAEVFQVLDLPRSIKGVGPNLTDENLLQSVAAALHLSNQPLTGQQATKALMDKNPGVNINTDQPLIQALVVTDEDIRRQERRGAIGDRDVEKKVQASYKYGKLKSTNNIGRLQTT
ncbi:unnamed protein product [Owenia fusiformis]|uniref:MBD domain-containing protein n=1 Tax=Owenia fusiformis TaxID=6347 RepID=A0A8S4PV31_OWEFU|nr:unnamed protein product [Owenia fusiformis]